MLELPPLLRGSEREQLAALRDYLVRLARSLDAAQTASLSVSEPASAAPATGLAAARRETAELRSLVVKTAERVEHSVEMLRRTLREDYLALSAFGSYRETVESTIEATARGVLERYDFEGALAALEGRLGGAESALTALRGEIRRGLITDPDTGETALGIAIAEDLRFTGALHTADGLVYHELAPGQTLGLYTATGWQFWIGGTKRGWFDAADGMLHARRLAVEQSLRLGADWLLTAGGGFGIRYVGG